MTVSVAATQIHSLMLRQHACMYVLIIPSSNMNCAANYNPPKYSTLPLTANISRTNGISIAVTHPKRFFYPHLGLTIVSKREIACREKERCSLIFLPFSVILYCIFGSFCFPFSYLQLYSSFDPQKLLNSASVVFFQRLFLPFLSLLLFFLALFPPTLMHNKTW